MSVDEDINEYGILTPEAYDTCIAELHRCSYEEGAEEKSDLVSFAIAELLKSHDEALRDRIHWLWEETERLKVLPYEHTFHVCNN